GCPIVMRSAEDRHSIGEDGGPQHCPRLWVRCWRRMAARVLLMAYSQPPILMLGPGGDFVAAYPGACPARGAGRRAGIGFSRLGVLSFAGPDLGSLVDLPGGLSL